MTKLRAPISEEKRRAGYAAALLLEKKVLHLARGYSATPSTICIVCGERAGEDHAAWSSGESWARMKLYEKTPYMRCCDLFGLPDPSEKKWKTTFETRFNDLIQGLRADWSLR